MSLIARDYYPMVYESPMERMIYRNIDDAMRDFDRSLRTVTPYWLRTPTMDEYYMREKFDNIVNNTEKFEVEMDVSQFRPNEIKVNLRERDLIVEGRHEERADETGRIERHFVRKYRLPEDTDLEKLESHLNERGILNICAKKLPLEGKHMRNIPISQKRK